MTSTGAPSSPVAFQPGQAVGFFTDTTLCIGCKACEVACKQWNQLPANDGGANTLTGNSYDNTGQLDGINWRHVKFIEQFTPDRKQGRWLMMSDVCKHCVQAGCLEVCPTGAIIRTEFDTVVIQSDVCNGCRDCIAACPFGVIEINPVTKTAQKCTLCYDRLQAGLTPACAQACPTASIQFGPIQELRRRADARVATLKAPGRPGLHLRRREHARRAQRLLAADRQAGGVRPARRTRSCPRATSGPARCSASAGRPSSACSGCSASARTGWPARPTPDERGE